MKLVVFNNEKYAVRKGNWFVGYKFLIRYGSETKPNPWAWVGINHTLIGYAYHETSDAAMTHMINYENYLQPKVKPKTDFGRPFKYRAF